MKVVMKKLLVLILLLAAANLAAHYHHHDSAIEGVSCWTGVDNCNELVAEYGDYGSGWKCKVASTGAVTDEHKGVRGYCRQICWSC